MSWGIYLAVVGIFVTLWALGPIYAYFDSFATVGQMHERGIERGIPWSGHIACSVLDFAPFPWVMALWPALYAPQWTANHSWGAFLGVFVLGFVLSVGMHLTYIAAGKQFPEFVTYDGEVPPAFWAHVVYMGLGFTLVGYAYLFTAHPEPWLVGLTTCYLVLHVAVGVHLIYKVWTPKWFPYHGVDLGTAAPIIGVAVIMVALSYNVLS